MTNSPKNDGRFPGREENALNVGSFLHEREFAVETLHHALAQLGIHADFAQIGERQWIWGLTIGEHHILAVYHRTDNGGDLWQYRLLPPGYQPCDSLPQSTPSFGTSRDVNTTAQDLARWLTRNGAGERLPDLGSRGRGA